MKHSEYSSFACTKNQELIEANPDHHNAILIVLRQIGELHLLVHSLILQVATTLVLIIFILSSTSCTLSGESTESKIQEGGAIPTLDQESGVEMFPTPQTEEEDATYQSPVLPTPVPEISSDDSVQVFEGHTGYIVSMAFSPDGRILATGGDDTSIRLWDIRDGKQLLTIEGHTGQISDLMFSSDGKRLVTRSTNNEIMLWKTETGELIRKMEHDPGSQIVLMLQEDKLFLQITNEKIEVVGQETVEALNVSNAAHLGDGPRMSPDGKTIALVPSKNYWSVELWNMSETELIQRIDLLSMLDTNEFFPVNMAFSKDGETLIVNALNIGILLLRVSDGELIEMIEGQYFLLQYSPDSYLAALSFQMNNKYIEVWDVQNDYRSQIIEFPYTCERIALIENTVACATGTTVFVKEIPSTWLQ